MTAPVLLHTNAWDQSLHGSFEDALMFQACCFPGRLIAMERTSEPWVKRKTSGEVPNLI
jgi:hypothetical protein